MAEDNPPPVPIDGNAQSSHPQSFSSSEPPPLPLESRATPQLPATPAFLLPPVGDPVLPCGKKSVPCCPVKLRVTCGHGKRGYILDVPGAKTREDRPVLQLVADQLFRPGQGLSATPRGTGAADAYELRDFIRVDLIATSCQRGRPSAVGPGPWTVIADNERRDVWPAVTVSGSGVSTATAAPYAVSAYSVGLPPMLGDGTVPPWIGFNHFLTHFLLPQGPSTYSVGVKSCEGDPRFVADIEVFPAQSWTGDVTFEYVDEDKLHQKEFKSSKEVRLGNPNAKAKGREYNTNTKGFKVTCGLSVKYADKTIEVKPLEEMKYVRTAVECLGRVNDIEALNKGANKLTGIRSIFKVKYPKIKLSGTVERKEKKGSWEVGLEGSVKLSANPILGLTAEIDILDALISAAGAATGTVVLTKILLEVKKAAEEKRVCEISLKLSGEGAIFFETTWEGMNLRPTKCEPGCAFGLKLEGVVAVNNDWWNVSAGAIMGGETKFKITLKPDPKRTLGVKPKYEWSGVSVYYSTFISRPSGQVTGAASKSIMESAKKSPQVNGKREVKIIDKWEYPPEGSSGSPTDQSSGVGEYLT